MWRGTVLFLSFASVAYGADLRVDYTRESLTGTHVHYQQFIDGIRVVGGERIASTFRDGRRQLTDRLAVARESNRIIALSAAAPRAGELVYLNIDGEARLASRVVIEEQPHKKYANYYDAESGALIRSDPLFWSSQGRVFDVNPVAKLNRPDLEDANDVASAVPDAAYSIVDLPDLAPAGMLAGPNVHIIDSEEPFTDHADASQPLLFDRGQKQFEEVNVYFHLDRSQRYLQSLGYTGTRRIIPYSIGVDPHAVGGTDNSFFAADSPGVGELFYGDGGTDDAEDSDIMLHEYGHAIQESIAPSAFGGSSSSQSRALGEGFGDYWSFSSTYEATVPSGRDPFCIGDWDARCSNDNPDQNCGYPLGADCLRRVDSSKTMADFINSDRSGTEHRNGEIWSSALREIFMTIGRRTTDTLVLESTFGVPINPTYAMMGQRMLASDRALNAGANIAAICTAMTKRGILGSVDCSASPRGETTWYPSSSSTLTITDTRPVVSISLQTDIAGDGQPALIAPDGTRGDLSRFIGRSVAGTWTLEVPPAAKLVSWSLVVVFQGDTPAPTRPAGSGKFIAAAGNVAGANGTHFITDVRLFNRGNSQAELTAIFTPSSANGQTTFDAIKVVLAPQQIVALNDIVGTAMQAEGNGQLELIGADNVLVMSRTYTRSSSGSYGQFVPSADPSEATGASDLPISLPGLENSDGFRTNIGFAEVTGANAEVHVRFIDASGAEIDHATYSVPPFGHLQAPMNAKGEAIRAEVTVAGSGRVLAYASVIDNRSGDAIFIPAARQRAGFIPFIHSPGVNGTLWRTDLWLSRTNDGATVFRDFLHSDGISFAFTGGQNELATSRTYTDSGSGTYGQFIPPGTARIGLANLIGVENDAAFRTNIGFIAPSASTVRFVAYDATGIEVWRSDVSAQGLIQFPLPVTLTIGRVTAEVIAGGGVVPYASVIDNQSGDPIYITAQY